MKPIQVSSLSPLPEFILRLRALILALGESVRPPLWKTEFMNETGLRFLERIYPRNSFQASVHAAGKSACDVHDRAVGRVGVYHLFRLPESLETEIRRIPPDFDEEFVSQFRAGLGHPDMLIEMLVSMCSGVSRPDDAAGAKRIGNEGDLTNAAGFKKAGAVYQNAFAQGKPAFPYFAAEQNGSRR